MADSSSHRPTEAPVTANVHKILVVDDEPINIQVLHRTFAPEYQVFMATSGPQALKTAAKQLPDLILLDVSMPEMDGFDVCRALKADQATKDIPVIFVTAHNDPVRETMGLEVGAVDFISKPINPAVVRARVATHLTLKAQSDRLRQMVFVDGLTGAYNRRYLDSRLTMEWARARRAQTPISIVQLDVDYFKPFNDRYGHPAGDACLSRVAKTVMGCLRRPADMLARAGGDEFVCVLPETGEAGARQVGADIERAVRAMQLPHADGVEPERVVSVSVGVATWSGAGQDVDVMALLALADAQAYSAKESGRARVCSASLG